MKAKQQQNIVYNMKHKSNRLNVLLPIVGLNEQIFSPDLSLLKFRIQVLELYLMRASAINLIILLFCQNKKLKTRLKPHSYTNSVGKVWTCFHGSKIQNRERDYQKPISKLKLKSFKPYSVHHIFNCWMLIHSRYDQKQW